MPESKITHLRIYCICGQKMKMSEKMFGLPGKCVACRQKIRIPRRDEIPAGVDTIYLKDFPEFLRKVERKRPPARKPEPVAAGSARRRSSNPVKVRHAENAEDDNGGAVAVAQTPVEEVALADDGERISTVPIDILEPLRNVCSVQYKLEQQLRTLDKLSTKDSANRAEVKGRLSRLRTLRADLDEQLRQVLMEVAIELASTEEKIVQTGLSARVGEMSFEDYRETIDRLRRRRDRLERRQQNLRGWLATTDPHMAGGYLDLPFESLPNVGFNLTLPSDPEDNQPLVQTHISSLKGAFLARAHAERKLAEMERMAGPDARKKRGFVEARADAKAEAKIAVESVSFARNRLEQLALDYASDAETYDAQLDLARGRLQVGEIDRSQFDAMESTFLRAKTDAAKARALIKRSLNANSLLDVPEPRGTFLGRLRAAKPEPRIGVDQWLAWGAAIFMGVSIFLPAAGRFSLVQAFLEFDTASGLARWSFFGPILYAIVVAATAAIPAAFARGRVLILVWLLATVLGAFAIHQTKYGLDPISSLFRSESLWFMQPGMFVLLAAHVAVAAAAGICLMAMDREPWLFVGSTVAGAILVIALFTDFFGYFVPQPAVAVASGPPTFENTPTRVITVTNSGRRAMHLLSEVSDARAAYLFSVERQEGPTSWSEVSLASKVSAASTALSRRPVNERIHYTIAPGDTMDLELPLATGDYRVLLRSEVTQQEIIQQFRVEPEPAAAPEIVEPEPIVVPETDSAPETPEATPPTVVEPAPIAPGSQIKLIGILVGEDRDPRFSFGIEGPDGTEQKITVAIGETVHGPWSLAEYNPALHTITLANESQILVLRTGDQIQLR